MRICTNCGHIPEADESVCSICGSDLTTDTGTVPAPEDETAVSDGDTNSLLFSSDRTVELKLELPAPAEVPEEAEPVREETADTGENAAVPLFSSPSVIELRLDHTAPEAEEPADEAAVSADEEDAVPAAADAADEITAPLFSFTTATIELDLDQNAPEAEPELPVPEAEEQETETAAPSGEEPAVSESAPSGSAPEPGNENYRVVKVKVRNDQKLKNVNKERVAIVVIALLALVSMISAVFMIVVPLIQARRQDEAAKEAAYMEFLTGEWLSETFIYSGEQYPSCEILTVGKDHTFKSEIWTSPNDRETYDPETWTVTARQAGDLAVELETSSLRVSYTDGDGNVMVYRRYILKLDSSSLILREYYNEKMTDYYDVVFTRKGNS